MVDTTALAESAQALFCAIADYVGINEMEKKYTLEKYPTYSDFKSLKKNQKLITTSFKQTKIIGVSLPQIEKFLKNSDSWYESSLLIAIKLLKDIKKIDSDFTRIQGPNWQGLFYIRGGGGGDTVMNNIEYLFKHANKNDKKFGDVNKWSPADIYFVSQKGRKNIQNEADAVKENKSYTWLELNTVCNKLIKSGDLLPLSLKKVISGIPTIVKYNFQRTKEEKDLASCHYIGTRKSKTFRDIQISFKDSKSQLKIRHDPHHSKFGASAILKCEIIVQGMGGRLGSIGTINILLSVIRDASCKKSAKKFHDDLKQKFDSGFKAYKKGIDKLNSSYKVNASDSHDKLKKKLKGGKTKYDLYKDERAAISQKTLMKSVIPVIEKYFESHKKSKKEFSDSTIMLQSFIKYASSRSPNSGNFVIAK